MLILQLEYPTLKIQVSETSLYSNQSDGDLQTSQQP